MHFFDLIVVASVGFLIFGPKVLQSIARSAGKTAAQANMLKEKLLSELPMEEFSQLKGQIPQVPLNSHQAMQMLLTPEESATHKTTMEKQQIVKVEEE